MTFLALCLPDFVDILHCCACDLQSNILEFYFGNILNLDDINTNWRDLDISVGSSNIIHN